MIGSSDQMTVEFCEVLAKKRNKDFGVSTDNVSHGTVAATSSLAPFGEAPVSLSTSLDKPNELHAVARSQFADLEPPLQPCTPHRKGQSILVACVCFQLMPCGPLGLE